MLTHVIQSREAALFLIDEPDIYLHSDLQRQLLGLLRNMGPDIVVATHSTEIIVEAEVDDLVLVNKQQRNAKRIQHPSQLQKVFEALGSNINPILTQLAKTRRVVFVEGSDFQILAKFAQKLGYGEVGSRRDFAVVPVGGCSPDRVRTLRVGIETTLRARIRAAAVLDRDYRSDAECEAIRAECAKFCDYATIHRWKEIENFLLVPRAIDRAVKRRLADQMRRTGKSLKYDDDAAVVLNELALDCEIGVQSDYISNRNDLCADIRPG
jgi:predicted ATP-dependent endonuclease of OLD family